jgi:hypothetical protein
MIIQITKTVTESVNIENVIRQPIEDMKTVFGESSPMAMYGCSYIKYTIQGDEILFRLPSANTEWFDATTQVVCGLRKFLTNHKVEHYPIAQSVPLSTFGVANISQVAAIGVFVRG